MRFDVITIFPSIFDSFLATSLVGKAIEKMDRTAEATLLRFHHVYLEAMAAGEFGAAVSALRDIAKYHGLFERDKTQRKKLTQAEVDRKKAELERLGVSFARKAFVGMPGYDERGWPLKPGENYRRDR